jgi:glycine/D-amino acid oxidase-like deaminating enzyme
MYDYDLVVVGLGVYGASVISEAASRGLTVLGLDQYELSHSSGSSHGGSRIFRRTTLESDHYVPLARRAADLWSAMNLSASNSICASTGFALISPEGTSQQTHHGVDNVGHPPTRSGCRPPGTLPQWCGMSGSTIRAER